jgi:DNA mismatch repair ATPase MutS
VLSTKNNQRLTNIEQLVMVNKQEIQILTGKFRDMPSGSSFLAATHEYAHDLDIFGRASLFQYINRTTSEQGSRKLADWLLAPSQSAQILERQEAVKELSKDYLWRQQLQAFGNLNRITENTEQKIENWLNEPDSFAKPHWKWLRFLLPATICSALLLYLFDELSSTWFYLLVFISFIVSGIISRKATVVYFHLDKIVKEISSLSSSVEWIEKKTFEAALLKNLQQQFFYNDTRASLAVNQLKEILDRLDYRLNPLVFIPLNTFLFWDLQQVMLLEKWKDAHAAKVSKWFQALGELEAISSLANIALNHGDWEYPKLTETNGVFEAKNLGHPLIPFDKRVCSSFYTSGIGKIALITGSNMAGKSTFLRSVGVNIVLAMMGAPVCAESLSLSPVKVMSSMRVTDNLEESTSTFYAELKKLKQIIEAVNKGEKVFLLLDEILRGTNSLDRHTGSKALIRQLLQHQAVGMLATHDLELAKLADEYPGNIHNYHFDVQVAGEELYFDYKLKEGVCESLNASILMKKIGIEL